MTCSMGIMPVQYAKHHIEAKQVEKKLNAELQKHASIHEFNSLNWASSIINHLTIITHHDDSSGLGDTEFAAFISF